MDALNRTAGQLYIDGTRVTNTWDAAGQQITQQDLLGIRSFGYDLDGRQTSVAFPTGLNLSHSFDAVSNRISTLDPDNGLTSWSYDSQNRIGGIANPLGELTTITWDALDREQHKVLANGMAVSHTFDAAGRETLLENRNSAGVGLAIFSNTYDAASNRLTVLELDGTRVTFGYDSTYQLTSEQRSGPNAYNTSYVYDPLGNRTQKFDSGALTSSQYNAANELTLVTPPTGPPTTSTFDQNGNLATQNTGGALTTYQWDPENRLLTVSDNTGITTASYSADGLRQKKVVGATATNFVWDDQNVLQERDGSLAKTAQYTDWPGYWGGLASQSRSGASSFYGFDSQGSTRVLVAIGGAIADSYSYRAFGEELAAGSGTVNPFRYVGQFGYFRDAEDSLYVRARYPDVRAGRWISRDPIELETVDYSYCLNRPQYWIDPSGLQPPPTLPPGLPPPTTIIRPSPAQPPFRLPPGYRITEPITRPISRPIVAPRPSPAPGGLPRWCKATLTGGLIVWFICEASPCGPTSEFGPDYDREREIRRQHCIDQEAPCLNSCPGLTNLVANRIRRSFPGSAQQDQNRRIKEFEVCCEAWCKEQLMRCLARAGNNLPPEKPDDYDCSPFGKNKYRPNPFI